MKTNKKIPMVKVKKPKTKNNETTIPVVSISKKITVSKQPKRSF